MRLSPECGCVVNVVLKPSQSDHMESDVGTDILIEFGVTKEELEGIIKVCPEGPECQERDGGVVRFDFDSIHASKNLIELEAILARLIPEDKVDEDSEEDWGDYADVVNRTDPTPAFVQANSPAEDVSSLYDLLETDTALLAEVVYCAKKFRRVIALLSDEISEISTERLPIACALLMKLFNECDRMSAYDLMAELIGVLIRGFRAHPHALPAVVVCDTLAVMSRRFMFLPSVQARNTLVRGVANLLLDKPALLILSDRDSSLRCVSRWYAASDTRTELAKLDAPPWSALTAGNSR